MIQGATLQHWSSPADPQLRAAELIVPSSHDGDFAATLAAAAGKLDGAAFVVISIDDLADVGSATVTRAVAALRSSGSRARLCLAGRLDVLQRVDTRVDPDDVGLLLDDVGIDTPALQLVWDRLEAVRFHHDFVAAAARGFRHGCALDALIGLAKSLGLCTLGEDLVPGGAALAERVSFDYVPSVTRRPAAGARSGAGRVVDMKGRALITS